MPSINMSKKRYLCSDCKEANTQICKHLQKRLPKASGASVRAILTQDIQNYPTTEGHYSLEEKDLYFRDKLFSFGLEEIRVEVLTLYFVYNCSLAEIAEILSIPTQDRPSKGVVYRIYKQSLELLKERGYNLE
jgi:DNA-directed RNA polymerase specialized sigma subunit